MSDLLRSAFHRGPVQIEADGIVFVFDYRPASWWLERFGSGAWNLDLLRHADDASYEALLDRLESGRARPEDANRVARRALAEAAGRPWWEAERLVSVLGNSEMLGAALRGADPEHMSLAAFLSVVYSLLMKGADMKDRMKIEAELSVPPYEAAGEEEEEDFTAMVSAMRNMPGVSIG